MNSQVKDKIIRLMLLSAASTSIIVVTLIFLFMFKESLPFFQQMGLGEVFHERWIPVSFERETFGIVPLFTGTIMVTGMATIIAIPFGVFGAIYISEIASDREREFLKPFIELLAGIPSVVIGFFGLIVLAPVIKALFGLPSGLTALTGALLLALMAIPTIVSISEDAIRSVPTSYKQASIALGATKLQTIFRVTVPAAFSGIIASITLGVGRVIGETMAVLMVTGNAARITASPLESVRTMTATIAAEMGEVEFGGLHYSALFVVGIILLLFTFVLTILAQRALRKYRRN